MYRVVVLALAAVMLVGCASGASATSNAPEPVTTTSAVAAPSDVVATFDTAIERSITPYCTPTECPHTLEVTGSPAAWDVAMTINVSGESLGDPMYAALEAVSNYVRATYAVFHANLPVQSFEYTAMQDMKDDYGNAATKAFVQLSIAGSTADKINWPDESVDGFMHLSKITWFDNQFNVALARCQTVGCPNILPVDFHCTAVRQGLEQPKQYDGCIGSNEP